MANCTKVVRDGGVVSSLSMFRWQRQGRPVHFNSPGKAKGLPLLQSRSSACYPVSHKLTSVSDKDTDVDFYVFLIIVG